MAAAHARTGASELLTLAKPICPLRPGGTTGLLPTPDHLCRMLVAKRRASNVSKNNVPMKGSRRRG